MEKLVDTKEVGKRLKELGYSSHHISRNIRSSGYTLHRIRRSNGHSGYAITKEDAEKFLSSYVGTVEIEPVVLETKDRVEERIRQSRVNDGWISFRLSSPGMPDLINLKRNEDGSFEILFEEVKGPGDGLRKEQHSVLESMKKDGIPAAVTWVD
jgi:hypothetical protein